MAESGTTESVSPAIPAPAAGAAAVPGRWADSASHRAWLDEQLRKQLRFSLQTIRPAGGFHYPTATGTPQPDRDVELFLTARLTHVAAIAAVKGLPGAGRLLDHGVESLLGSFFDSRHGGFVSSLGRPDARKSAYDQVHVGLAAASAIAAGHPDGGRVLERVVDAIDSHLWDPEFGMLRETFAADWSDSEEYRGANANMHGTEAFLAIGDVTGDPVWHQRALGMADRIVNVGARALGWLVPEHFDAAWRLDREYNAAEPNHPFRPYGATPGHLLEWSRFLVGLHSAPDLPDAPWLLEAADGLITAALGTWGVDGVEGLVYTVGWDGRPVSRLRMHWPVCEGIQATAAYDTATGGTRWESWYRTLWDHATRFIDDQGLWVNELDIELNPSENVWPGRPDVYHSVGTYIVPTVPTSPFMTLALARGLEASA